MGNLEYYKITTSILIKKKVSSKTIVNKVYQINRKYISNNKETKLFEKKKNLPGMQAGYCIVKYSEKKL